MSIIKRVNTVFIYTQDMRNMRDFYSKILELGKPVVDTETWIEFDLPGCHLALHKGNEQILEQNHESQPKVKFSMEVENIEQVCVDLQAKNIKFTFGPKKDFGATLAEFLDPEGNPLRLIEFK